MRKRTLTLLGAIACAASIVKLYAVSEPVASVAGGASFYHEKVQPILQKNCYGCHAASAMSGLRVDSVAAMLKGGSSGPSISPGDPDKSLLIIAVRRTDPNLQMPQGGPKLPDSEIATLEQWVKMGAPTDQPATTATSAALTGPVATASAAADYFETRVRPIFANNCYGCHTAAASGGLRVDSLQTLLKGGGSGPAIVPGNPDKSLLIEAVRQTGDLKMPKGGHLKSEDIKTLEEWVKMGAPWPNSTVVAAPTGPMVSPEQKKFWSFQPLHPVPVPAVSDRKWATTDVDKFVLAKLEREGLAPVRSADKRTLIRRATYDLTGLPPTPEEVASFEKDRSPKAYENLIDRLLASPRYGERWGRHWLDVVRYGEDDVRGLDPKGRGYMPWSGAYYYRDWVIKAFNDDMPYGTFVRAQLAGDKMPAKDNKENLQTGTAMLGQGPWIWDQAEPVQGRADERNERVDMVSRGMLGLTVACARCHNHKYDPILQKDYYALIGVFASTTYNEYPTESTATVLAWQRKQDEIAAANKELRDFTQNETDLLSEVLAYQTAKYMVAAWRVSGEPKMPIEAAASHDKVDPEMLERWVNYLKTPKKQYPFLKDWQAMVATGGSEDEAKLLAADYQKLVLNILAAEKKIKKENDIIKAKADVPERLDRDAKPSEFETDDQFCPGCNLELKALPAEKANLYIDLFMRSLESDELKGKPGLFVFRGWGLTRRLSPEFQEHLNDLNARIETLSKETKDLKYPFIHGVTDKPKPVNVAVNLRGNPHSLGDEVPRRFLEVLSSDSPKPFQTGSGRLELADQIVGSGLAARVFVNRVWKWHFGTGIVNTPDNFGKAGEKPTDPELLEYLANYFVDNGMSLKKLQRQIMLSSVYRLSSDDSKQNDEKDAANRLYWKFNRQRLDAEEVRDSVLFASGTLDLKKTGGPSDDFTDDNTRRTVYCKISRFRMNNFLQVFDFPNPSFTAEQRFSTIVPLQRLYFMNSGFVYKQADLLAKRVYPAGDDPARIRQAYQILFDREPSPKESELGLSFLKTTPNLKGEDINGQPTTAWREYARVLLSSNEFEFVN